MITVETIPYLGYAMVFYKHRSAYTDMCAHDAEASGMLLCAKYDGVFAGFICVTSNSREDRITYAFTIPEFRRKGVFSALALYVMENGERRLRVPLMRDSGSYEAMSSALVSLGFEKGEEIGIYTCHQDGPGCWDGFMEKRGNRLVSRFERRGYETVRLDHAGEDIISQIRDSHTFETSSYFDHPEKKLSYELSFAAVRDGKLAAYTLVLLPDPRKAVFDQIWESPELKGSGVVILPFAASIGMYLEKGCTTGVYAVYRKNTEANLFVKMLPEGFNTKESVTENYCYYRIK